MMSQNGNGSNGSGQSKLLYFAHAPQRVVSLVPSLTESLFELGLGNSVVGVTDYCTRPVGIPQELPRLGGTKNPDIQKIIDLKPDLVVANQEENTLQDVEALEAAGIAVWVTFPRSVDETMDVMWKIVELFRNQTALVRLKTLQVTLDWTVSSAVTALPFRYFCPIWQDTEEDIPWWMTFNRNTYMDDLLSLMGGQNIFADRERRYPLQADLGLVNAEVPDGRDTRYPRVRREEVLAGEPEVILLPNEPYAYDENALQTFNEMFADTPAVRDGRLICLDGSLITWPGTGLARALRELPVLLGSEI